MNDTTPSQLDITQLAQTANALETQIRRAVIGQQQVIREVVIGLLAGGHVLVEGVPGLGKTLIAKSLAPPDQLSALVILANYGRPGTENVTIPYAAGCQTIGIFPYREAKSENPRAVVGLTDISARENLRKQLGRDLFSFAVPWRMFLEMEGNVKGSFLQRRTWKVLSGETDQ